ncbi:MAG: type III-B CRISPR module RAMP protein Cmr1 [Peptococcaceae bacterium]|nr:type III-B CRISPR module RAMP protein Cmr1 [Peptococcaceae bacterium]
MFEAVTPLFIGGADVRKGAEFRATSLKGALRYWYRAVDPEYRKREADIFGGVGNTEGQSKFLIKVTSAGSGSIIWDKNDYKGIADDPHRNGVTYFGYPLDTVSKEGRIQREHLKPGEVFHIQLLFKEKPEELIRKAVLSSFWLLGHVGGLGFRCRRGFGTVALKEWKVLDGKQWAEMSELKLTHGSKTPEEWAGAFDQGIKTISGWFGINSGASHTVLNGESRFFLAKDGFGDGKKKGKFYNAWVHALNKSGTLMQEFRRLIKSDYSLVKGYICFMNKKVASAHGEVIPVGMKAAPQRVRFGLPLTFRYESLAYNAEKKKDIFALTFQGKVQNRSASPVWVRIIKIGDRCYPFFAFFNSPLLPKDEKIVISFGKEKKNPLQQPADLILKEFQEWLKEKMPCWEVRL